MHASGWLGALATAVALSGATPARAAGAAVQDATAEQARGAQKAFQAGDRLFDDKHFADALTAFRESYEIVASPNARLMIARSLRELGRIPEAHAEFEATLIDAEQAAQKSAKYRATAIAAQDDLAALNATVAFVKISLKSAPTGATVSVAGRTIDPSTLDKPVIVTPGRVLIRASAPDRADQKMELSLAAGATESVELDLAAPAGAATLDSGEPADPEPQPAEKIVVVGPNTSLRTWAYVSGGIGAAGLVAFGVFGALNNSTFNKLEDECPGGHCPPGRDDDIDWGYRYQTWANVGLIVGAVGVATGVTLFVLSGKREKKVPVSEARLAVGPGAMLLRGQF